MYVMFKDKLKIVHLTNVNNYLYNGKGKIRVDLNNSSEKLKKKKTLRLMFELQTRDFKDSGPILHLMNYVTNLIGSLAA
jgi:hypothetical protein